MMPRPTQILGMVIGIVGFAGVWHAVNWQAALAVMVIVFGNNLERQK